MNIFIYLFLLILAINPAYAHLHGDEEQDKVFNYKSPDDIEPYQAVDHGEEYYGCSGYLRTGFLQTKVRSVDTSSATAMAGELGCGYRLNSHIKAHLGLFGVLDTGLNSHDDDNIHGDFFNRKKDSYLMLGEAVLTLSYGDFEAHLGRQNFDSPHLDSDDLRMVANLFEAYLVDYHLSDEFYLGAGFIREASGWENGGNLSHFVPIGEALGGRDGNAWVSWLAYEQEHMSGNAWFYLIPDHLTIFYGELMYSNFLTSEISYDVGLQYDWGLDSGAARLGEIDAQTLGFMTSISGYDVTLTAAYNKNFGNTGAVASLGGGAFFTSLEDQTLDAATGEDTQSILLGVEYALSNEFTLGVAMAEFRAANKKDYQVEEINYFLNYNWNDKLTAELIYAVIDDKNSSEDTDQIRAMITYRY
ncbi:MAG: outer membrane porin, OprD family [Methylococcaceae bacterium]|nr:outer membrane porin, OprD family [Methylococcaceae bacterium]